MSQRLQVVTTGLSGGVSQQPASVRFPNQVEDAQNVAFTVTDGAAKRPGTIFERAFADDPGANIREHAIDRDGSERYIVIYGAGILRAFRDGGAEATVNVSGAAATYLALNGATADDLELVQIADYTLIINTTVATDLIPTTAFTIERVRRNYNAVISYTTTSGYYVQSDEDSDLDEKGFYVYGPGTYAYSLINFATLTNDWTIPNGQWDDAGQYPSGFVIAFRRVNLAGFTAATFTFATKTITKVGAFASYTWRQGDQIYITAGTGFTVGWYTIASKTSSDAIVLVAGQTGMAGADNADTAANVTDAVYSETNRCRIGLKVEVSINPGTTTYANMDAIALALQTAIRAGGASNACVAWVPQGTGGAFQISGPWRGDNAMTYYPSAPTVAGVFDLTAATRPFDDASAQLFGGSGGSAPDSEDTASPESRWTRSPAPGQADGQLDSTKMPLRMVRSAANVFDVSAITWNQRTSGDATTNPFPKLFTSGRAIASAAMHEDRLWLGGGENICSSQAGDYFNFTAESASNAVDSDPIDRTFSGSQIADVAFIVPFRRVLVVFTDPGIDYEISSDGPMTPSSCSVSQSAVRLSVPGVKPQPFSSLIYFASPTSVAGALASLCEYYYDDIRVSSDVAEVTAHVPELLPSTIRSIAASPENGAIAVIGTDLNHLFVYRAYWSGSRKEQSAWGTYQYDEDIRICDGVTMGGDLWLCVENVQRDCAITAGSDTTIAITGHGLLVAGTFVLSGTTCTPSLDGTRTVKTVVDANTITIEDTTTVSGVGVFHTGGYTLERQPMGGREPTRTTYPYPVHGDRRIYSTGSFSAGTTTWTLPSGFSGFGSTLTKIVLGPAFGANAGDVLDITGYTSTTVTIAGDYDAGEVTLCREFETELEPTRPFVRDDGGRPDIVNDTHIETVTVVHRGTCSYELTASQSLRTDRTRTFDNLHVPTAGKLFTLLSGPADGMTLTLFDDSVKPCAWVGISYEVEHGPIGITTGRR